MTGRFLRREFILGKPCSTQALSGLQSEHFHTQDQDLEETAQKANEIWLSKNAEIYIQYPTSNDGPIQVRQEAILLNLYITWKSHGGW